MSKRSSKKKESDKSEKFSSSERRPKYLRSDLMRMAREDLVDRFIILQNLNIKFYEEVNPMMAKSESDLAAAREINLQLTSQLEQQNKKEAFLNIRLNNKHLESHDLMAQVQDMRAMQMDGATSQLNHKFLDPAVNHIFEKMKSELNSQKKKCQDALENASALNFNPDSELGKRLVAKCRQLSQENRELSEEVSRLEDEVEVERQVVRETRTHQLEFEHFMLEMEDQLESMQGVVVAQNCSIKSLNSRLLQLTELNRGLQTELDLKSPPLKDVCTMVTSEDLPTKETRAKSDGDTHKEAKRELVKNNHPIASKARSKKVDKVRNDTEREKGKGEKGKFEKEKVDKERLEKEKIERERGEKERKEKDRSHKDNKVDKERTDKDRSDKERSDKEKGDRSRKRTHDGRETDKRVRHRSRSRNNHEVSNGHRSTYK